MFRLSAFGSFLALLSLRPAAAAVAQQPAACTITGNIKGLDNKPVVFFYDHNGHQLRDTVRATNGHFTYAAHPSDDGLLRLKLVPGKFATIWYEPGQVSVAGDMARPAQLTVTGTPENQLSTQYNQQIDWQLEPRAQAHPDSLLALERLHGQATRRFIQAHPQARTSASLLYQQTKYPNDQPLATYEQLWRGLAPAVRASVPGQAVASRLAALRKQPQVGRSVPTFILPDTAGVTVSLDRFKGQYVLLDFWGHWCSPCLRAMPHLKELQQQYSRQLAVVGIGMERADDKNLWLQAIRRHQLTWTQLSELKADKGVIEQYNIEEFPTYLLLDQQGVLLVKASSLDAIADKLKTLPPLP